MTAIDDLVTEPSRLPTIGRKPAMRLTYHLLRQPAEQSRRLAEALVTLAEKIRPCSDCFNLTESERCALCTDPRRDRASKQPERSAHVLHESDGLPGGAVDWF